MFGQDCADNYVLRTEDDAAREKALQTVVAGQQAENLLDFDAEESSNNDGRDKSLLSDGGFDGLGGVGGISSQAIASAAKSTNPLDELMDLFSSASMTAPTTNPPMSAGAGMGMGMGGGAGMSAVSSGGGVLGDLMSPSSISPAQTGQSGLSGQSGMGGQGQGQAQQNTGGTQKSQSQGAGAQDDLLGLF